MNIKFSNWFAKNTPRVVQIIGDIGLLAAFFSANFLVFKQNLIDIGLTSLANSPYLDRTNAACLFLGVLIKFGTKFIGGKEFTNPELENKLQQTTDEIQSEVKRLKDLKLIPQNWIVTIKK